jgi:hypothetical protein
MSLSTEKTPKNSFFYFLVFVVFVFGLGVLYHVLSCLALKWSYILFSSLPTKRFFHMALQEGRKRKDTWAGKERKRRKRKTRGQEKERRKT